MSILKKLKDASSLADLAAILGYWPSTLAYIVYRIPPDKKYTKFTIPKSGGGTREICAPIEPLKTLQRHLANVLYACTQEIDSESGRRLLSHGFRRKLSIVTNARRHKRRRYVLNLDLQDFFTTFNFGRVRGSSSTTTASSSTTRSRQSSPRSHALKTCCRRAAPVRRSSPT